MDSARWKGGSWDERPVRSYERILSPPPRMSVVRNRNTGNASSDDNNLAFLWEVRR